MQGKRKNKIAKDHREMQNMSIILLRRNVFIYNLNLRLYGGREGGQWSVKNVPVPVPVLVQYKM